MFGQLQVTTILKLSKLQTLDEAVAKLLQFADYPEDRSLVPVPNGSGGLSGP